MPGALDLLASCRRTVADMCARTRFSSPPGGAVDIAAKLILMRLSDKFKDRTVRPAPLAPSLSQLADPRSSSQLFAMVAICFPFMGGLIMMLAPQDNAGPLLFGYYCISAAGASWGLVMICISNNTIGFTKKSVVNGVQIIAYGAGNWVGQSCASYFAPNVPRDRPKLTSPCSPFALRSSTSPGPQTFQTKVRTSRREVLLLRWLG